MPYSAEAIANFFIDLVRDSGNNDLSPMKLQKLVYFAHGWYLAITGEPLVEDRIQAWRFGPVIQELYREFKEFGNQPITRRARDMKFEAGRGVCQFEPSIGDDASVTAFLRRIWDVYGPYSAVQLSNMTHAVGTPWHQVVLQWPTGLPSGISIPNELIREYFKRQLKPPAHDHGVRTSD